MSVLPEPRLPTTAMCVGDAGHVETQQFVDEPLGLVAEEGLLRNVIKVENGKILDRLGLSGEVFLLPPQVFRDVHARINSAGVVNHASNT